LISFNDEPGLGMELIHRVEVEILRQGQRSEKVLVEKQKRALKMTAGQSTRQFVPPEQQRGRGEDN
jgi:hypothetical protein